MTGLRLSVEIESWPLKEAFTISRGAKTEAVVVLARVTDGVHYGRGECVPYARYGETVEGVRDQALALKDAVARGIKREDLRQTMSPGAARNALDCALWDYEAKKAGKRVFELLGTPPPKCVETCYTVSLGAPDDMAAKARDAGHMPILKLKLGGDGDAERVAAVRAAAPRSRLVADANEAWRVDQLAGLLAACAKAGVELVEQPLPAGQDAALAHIDRSVPICADESAHTSADIPRLVGLYDAVNVKLDKAGGLTEALTMSKAARDHGFKIMVGCMVATSLSMAPAMLLAQDADWADLDGPLLLAKDREDGLAYAKGIGGPPSVKLWG